MKFLFIKTTLLSFLAISAISCGGGKHHHHDYVGAANVSISGRPTTIDTGDRTTIKINISKVHNDGILLKIHYPNSLRYVVNSAYIHVDDIDIPLTPDVDTDVNNYANAGHFLVFFLNRYVLDDKNYGTLNLELEGKSYIKKGEIGVDADVNDLTIDDECEFDPLNPEYSAEAYINVTVRR